MRPMPETISVSDTAPISRASEAHFSASSAHRRAVLIRGAGVLACVDSLAACAAVLAMLISAYPHLSSGIHSFLSARISVKNVLLLIVLAAVWPAIFHLFGLYEARRLRQLGAETKRVAVATTTASGLGLIFPLTSVSGTVALHHLPFFWLAALALSLLVRVGRRAVERARNGHARRALIVGTGRLARHVDRDIRADRPHGYEVVGFIDAPTTNGDAHFDRIQDQTIGTLDELEQLLMREVIDEVIIALPVKSCYQQIQYAIGVCERAGIQAKYGADLFESHVAFPRYDDQAGRAFVAMHVAPDDYRLAVKRAIDVIGAMVGLIILAPLMVVVAIAIKLTSAGQIIYVQDRCGFSKRPLRMYKFRSMFADADKRQDALETRNEALGPVFKIRNDPRITPLGRLLRRSSIDELPQLWNVLRGDMSLVGPRPLPWRDVRRITRPSDMRRFSMRPGLTCLWQVQGRSNIDFERWVELDLEYIDRWSLALDAHILLKTIPAVLSGDGAT
jgi:exopolysaccharide biosynthesis polyprenyl glycosylphosphotransferase